MEKLIKKHDTAMQLLKMIAYPRRGSVEENLSIYDLAKHIQNEFTLNDFLDVDDYLGD